MVIAGHLLNELAFDGSISELDARQEGNSFTWASTVAAFAGALAATLHALLLEAHRVKLGLMAAALALISFDDLVRLHERLGGRLADGLDLPDAIAEGAELLLFAPLLLGTLIVGWLLVGELSAKPARQLRLGLSLLVVAVVLEVFGAPTRAAAESGADWSNELRIALEEGVELAGLIIVGGTLVGLLCESLIRSAVSSGPALKRGSEPDPVSEHATG